MESIHQILLVFFNWTVCTWLFLQLSNYFVWTKTLKYWLTSVLLGCPRSVFHVLYLLLFRKIWKRKWFFRAPKLYFNSSRCRVTHQTLMMRCYTLFNCNCPLIPCSESSDTKEHVYVNHTRALYFLGDLYLIGPHTISIPQMLVSTKRCIFLYRLSSQPFP